MTPSVELVYDPDCPNVAAARRQLRKALRQLGLPPEWTEWRSGDPASPPYAQRCGSPTIFVDAHDVVAGAESTSPACCRIYATRDGRIQPIPEVEVIVSALNEARHRADKARPNKSRTGWRRSLATLPALGVALLPVGVCPACWPAYAGCSARWGWGSC